MNSMYDCGEKYAMPGYQLSQRDTYQNQEISVFSMIFDTNWIITTIKSFICTTGYMQYMISGNILFIFNNNFVWYDYDAYCFKKKISIQI